MFMFIAAKTFDAKFELLHIADKLRRWNLVTKIFFSNSSAFAACLDGLFDVQMNNENWGWRMRDSKMRRLISVSRTTSRGQGRRNTEKMWNFCLDKKVNFLKVGDIRWPLLHIYSIQNTCNKNLTCDTSNVKVFLCFDAASWRCNFDIFVGGCFGTVSSSFMESCLTLTLNG